MNIAFLIPSLGPGGAERVATLLCDAWAETGHNMSLITFEPSEAKPFHKPAAAVQIYGLDAASGRGGAAAKLAGNARRIGRLRALLKTLRPDVLVAFTTDANVIAVLAALGLKLPVVISERNQPDRPGLGRLHRLARKLTYPLASAIVVQTEPIAAWLRARFSVPVRIIPNPVRLEGLTPSPASPEASSGEHRLVAVGRLVRQKGFDVLIASFASIAARHPDWRLIIYGEGPERRALETLRSKSGLADRISLPGIEPNIDKALSAASLFVLPSRFEGYPNALIEALAANLPVIATSCPGGSAELLGQGKYGLLVPPEDEASLAAALDAMMADAGRRKSYAETARHAVAQLEVAGIAGQWLCLFSSLTGSAPGA